MRIGALDIGGTNIKACLFEDGAAGPLREAPTRAKEPGLLDRAAELLSALGDFDAIGVSTAGQVDPAIENGRQLFARQEDPALRQVLDRWLEEVAAGICALVHCYNIPCVLLGGGIMEQPLVFAKAKNLAEERLIPGFRGVTIRQAALGNMAGLYAGNR